MEDPIPTFSHLINALTTAYPQLAYIHVVEPRVDGPNTREYEVPEHESNDFIREIIRQNGCETKLISAGAYTRESGMEAADTKGDLIAYGRLYLSNVSLKSKSA